MGRKTTKRTASICGENGMRQQPRFTAPLLFVTARAVRRRKIERREREEAHLIPIRTLKELPNLIARNLRRRIQRIPINPRRDPTKRDTLQPILHRQLQRPPVTLPEKYLALLPLVPPVDRTDRVRDVLRRETVGRGELCFARFGTIEGFAFVVEGGTGGEVDGAVDYKREEKSVGRRWERWGRGRTTTAAEERLVGRVDDDIDFEGLQDTGESAFLPLEVD
jgi:hypothetical protein